MHEERFIHPAQTVESLGITPGMIIADFGVGSGHYTHEFAKRVGKEGKVYAVDVHTELLRRVANDAKKHGHENIEIIAGDVSREYGSKLRSQSVDMVLMSNVLFQLDNRLHAYNEARRILKPKGRLVVIDWSAAPERGRSFGPSREHVYRKEQALREAAHTHFIFLETIPAGSHHYGLMFEPE